MTTIIEYRKRTRIIRAAIAYLLIAVFTYGWTFERGCKGDTELGQMVGHACAAIAGSLWPGYWVLKASRDALKP